jgi:hypothetical protein
MKNIYNIVTTLAALFFAFTTFSQAHIGYVFPAGGQQGTSIDVVVGGQNLNNITGVYINGKGWSGEILEKIPVDLKAKNLRIKEQDIPQLEEQIKIRITLDKKAEPGIRDFRLVTEDGFTNRIFFEVGQLPEIREVEPNNSSKDANFVGKTPIVINGQIMPGKRDFFRFTANKGETLVCQTKSRVLVPYLADAVPGWFQAVLTLRDNQGKEVAYNDDLGQSPDPVIIYNVPESGEYTLEIKDAIYRGREDFVYRITIGEVPFVKSIFPLGGQKGKRVIVKLDGVNLSKYQMKVSVTKNSNERLFITAKGKNKLSSNPIAFAVSDKEESFLQDNSRLLPSPLPANKIINGAISQPGEEHWFIIEGKKGENITIEILAHRLGSLLDADLTLFDDKGKKLAQNDDFNDDSEGMETFHADPRLLYKFDKDGHLLLRLRDVEGHGGKEYSYRLWSGKPEPDFDLRIEPSNLIINQGGTTSFTVHALRKYNFAGAIELQLKNLPSGFSFSDNIIKKGQNELRMTLTAPFKADLGRLDLSIVGGADAKGIHVERKAEPVEEKMQAFIYLHLLPTSDFLGSVVKPLPFSLTHEIARDSIQLIQKNQGLSLKVKVNRTTGFNLPVIIALDAPPKGFRMKPVTLTSGESEATVIIENPFPRFNQQLNLVISGTARLPGKGKAKAKVYKVISQAIMVQSAR